jgi:hypothetical protein
MESGIGSYSNEVFVDVDLNEIKAIRDMLNELIEQKIES